MLNDEDLTDSPGWQIAQVIRQGAAYIVDSRDYFINFDKLVLAGLLEDVPASASKDNQPPGSSRTLSGPYSWFVNLEGRVESLLFFFPAVGNTGFQDVFPSRRQEGLERIRSTLGDADLREIQEQVNTNQEQLLQVQQLACALNGGTWDYVKSRCDPGR